MSRASVLLIEPCNFDNYPLGGQLAMALQLMKVFGNRLALVGLSTDDTPVRRWLRRDFGGQEYHFFAAGKRSPSPSRPLIPARLRWYVELTRCREAILALGITAAFVQAPESLLAISSWKVASICYQCPGVENFMQTSRYPGAGMLAEVCDRAFFRALQKTEVVLAAADTEGIHKLVQRSRGRLARDKVIFCPTCVDTMLFRPQPADAARKQSGVNGFRPVVVVSGRVNRFKGWPLLIEAFRSFLDWHPGAELVFVGDGEDRPQLEARAREEGLSERVRVTGNQPPEKVCAYLNAADIVVVGSYGEGWSVAMLEALACGKPLVSMDVSGARAMIREGVNGYIIPDRKPARFAKAMHDALSLPDARRTSLALAETYSLESFRDLIARVWPPLA